MGKWGQSPILVNFYYDGWGRTLSKTRGGKTATYGWGENHKLISVDSTFPDEGDVDYAYGGDGLRRSRIPEVGDETWYNWAGFSVINEEDYDGTPYFLSGKKENRQRKTDRAAQRHPGFFWLTFSFSKEKVRGNGTLNRTYVGNLGDIAGSNPATGTARYYTHDHLGSTRGVYDTTAIPVSLGSFEYTPYGSPYHDNGPTDLTHRFTGHDLDPLTGNYFAPYRYYDPGIARWMTRDPLGMVNGPNVYAYVKNFPTMATDPLGLCTNFNDCMDNCIGSVDWRIGGVCVGVCLLCAIWPPACVACLMCTGIGAGVIMDVPYLPEDS